MWGTMGRQERPLDPAAGPLQAFAHDLRQLRRGAGSPGYRALARRAGYSASVLSTAANGSDLPSLPVVLAYVGACRGDVKAWERRWQELAKLAAEWERPAAGPRGRRARPTEGASPRQLPPDVPAFTGRRHEIAELDRLMAQTRDAVTVAAIAGTAGVGKTALAVHWAHRVADRFPDDTLYVDLCGYGRGKPAEPTHVLHAFLRTLGLAGDHLPDGLAERAARFRSLLAGRRMLIVLDNACSAEQVRPLLPGHSSSFVVVTSRDGLAGLVSRQGARRIELDARPELDARLELGMPASPAAAG